MLLTLKVRLNMTDFIIKKLPYNLTSNAGLALAGQIMKRLPIGKVFDGKFPVGTAGITNSDILKSYHGLLVQGKNECPHARHCANAWIPTRKNGLSGSAPSTKHCSVAAMPSKPPTSARCHVATCPWIGTPLS